MMAWDAKLICKMIEGGISCFSRAHPTWAIPREHWHSIAKRSARMILDEHRRRFGNPVDRLVVQHVARQVMRILKKQQQKAA
jgi:hypothetical protein